MSSLRPALSYLLALKREASDDDLTGLAAELSFRFFMALFPFVLVLVSFGAFIARIGGVDDPSKYVIDAVGDSLPADASSVLSRQVKEVVDGANVGVLSISLATAIWASAGGARALMKAINRVYDLPETRKGATQLGIALGLTALGGLGLLLAVSAMMLSQAFAGSIAGALGIGREFGWAVQLARLPLIVLFVAAAVEVMYWLAPNRWTRPQLISVGGVVFALGWSAFTVGFAFYVSNFASYGATYGALAGVVIMLVWFYATSLLALLGAEINAMREREAMPEVQPVVAVAVETARPAAHPWFDFAVLVGLGLVLIGWARRSGAQGALDRERA